MILLLPRFCAYVSLQTFKIDDKYLPSTPGCVGLVKALDIPWKLGDLFQTPEFYPPHL